jgi:hypothetical protein
MRPFFYEEAFMSLRIIGSVGASAILLAQAAMAFTPSTIRGSLAA